MELRRLRYFVAVAEELHFRRAAELLHLAQPALSQQIRKLEAELGVELFHRSKRNVALTAAGAVLLEEARRVLRVADDAAHAARNARNGAAGAIRLGHVADAMPTAVFRTLTAFTTQYPGIRISAETLPARRAIEDVRAGRLDVAIVGLPAPVDGLRVTPLAIEGTVAAVSDRHPLSGRAAIPLSRLGAESIVVLPRNANPAFYDSIVGAFREEGVAPTLVEAAEDRVAHALLMAASGVGIALLPSSAAQRFSVHGVTFRPLEAPSPTTEIGVVTREEVNETSVAGFIRIVGTLERRTPLRAVS